MSEYRYKAFISYSHSDQRWATWLHRSLELYRVPRRLRGFEGQFGPVEERIRPVFKDREELGAAHSLNEEIRSALEGSQSLIVICSPAAAKSRWMNEEIRLFQSLGRHDRIFSIIVEGDPDLPPDAGGCFPEALVLDEQGNRHEPLAGDARPHADGKALALEKLLAGLLGIPLDLLRRREHQRRVRRRTVGVAAVLIAMVVLLFSGLSWQTSEQRRDSGQTLVAMKMNELRTLIQVDQDPTALRRLATFNADSVEAATARVEGGLQDAMTYALGLREQGQDVYFQGGLEEALALFDESWLVIALVYRAAPQDRNVLFELGQAEFWVGQIYYDYPDFEQAAKHFVAYAEITRQLIQSEPDNPEWVLEMAYALTNLGFLERDDNNDPQRYLQIMQSALEYNQIALLLEPGNQLYSAELGQSLANLADAQIAVCDIEGGLKTANDSIDHALKTFETAAEDYDHQLSLAGALRHRASLRIMLGEYASALQDLRDSRDILAEMHQQSPDDLFVAQQLQRRKIHFLAVLGSTGSAEEALEKLKVLAAEWNAKWQEGEQPTMSDRFIGTYILTKAAAQSERNGDRLEAQSYLDQAIKQLLARESAGEAGNNFDSNVMDAAFLGWEINEGEIDKRLMPYLPEASAPGAVRACDDAVAQLRLAIVEDDMTRAAYFSGFLEKRGFKEPEFIKLCNDYSVCNLP